MFQVRENEQEREREREKERKKGLFFCFRPSQSVSVSTRNTMLSKDFQQCHGAKNYYYILGIF